MRREVLLHDARGQMAVELAALVPVIVVVALVVYNLARFVELSATFDRVALDAVISQGVSPMGRVSRLSAIGDVRTCIQDAMGQKGSCEIEVSAEQMRGGSRSSLLAISPFLTRFTCVLLYRPWPSSLSLAGVEMGAPLTLRHERTIVVDCYRAGVVA